APQDPANADITTAIAFAYIKWANEAAANEDEEKNKIVNKSIERVTTALKGQEKNPAMQLAGYQLFSALIPLVPDTTEASKAKLRSDAKAALDNAISAARPSEDIYVDVMITAAA